MIPPDYVVNAIDWYQSAQRDSSFEKRVEARKILQEAILRYGSEQRAIGIAHSLPTTCPECGYTEPGQ